MSNFGKIFKFQVWRLVAWIWRFKTLSASSRVFESVTESFVLKRRFCGFKLYLDLARSSAQRLLFLEGVRFIGERHLIKGLAKPGDTVVDVGANIGYYMLLLRSVVGASGRIVCLEPEPSNLRELELNIAGNQLQNVRLVRAAAGAQDGSVSFHSGINGRVSSAGELSVPVVRLDTVVDGRVDFVKIDVEGYEGAVLEGAQEIIRTHKPAIFLELHPWLETSHNHREILELLEKYYDEVRVYEAYSGAGVLGKIAQRYFGAEPVRQINDREAVIADFVAGVRQNPLWVVCFRSNLSSSTRSGAGEGVLPTSTAV